MPKGVHLGDQQLRRIRLMVEAGATDIEIADALGIHPTTVGDRKAQLGLVHKRHRSFCFVSPSGEVHRVNNLKAFALAHGLHQANLSQVWRGRFSQHKGWRKA